MNRDERSGLDPEARQRIEQLNDENFNLRLDAIRALGRIARDSEEAFQPVTEALTAYVRELCPLASEGFIAILPEPSFP